jgi:hypothetical protein
MGDRTASNHQSGFERSSSFAADHFNERPSQSHLLVE